MYANRTPEGAYITKYLKIKDTMVEQCLQNSKLMT